MKNRAVRIALFLLVVLAFAGAAYELAILDRQAAGIHQACRAFEEKARQAENALRELRAAQFAYVAAGQGSAFWTARATALLSALDADLRALNSLEKAAAAAGVNAPVPAAGALEDLATVRRIDANVQRYLLEEQRLLASDLVFTDLREADQGLATRIEEARRQVAAAEWAAVEPLRRKQIATAGGSALFALLVLLLLLPAGSRTGGALAQAPGTIQRAENAGVASATATEPAADLSLRPAAALIRPIDFSDAAALCTEFARLRETSQLSTLLERVAALLDATGIIVWMADPARGQLRPVVSFGYPPQALAHIRAIPVAGDNATAQAYREQALRVVEEEALSHGAIAAPLIAMDGCVGVMAAEIRRGKETNADVQAAATIVAAQLATLIAPQTADGLTASP